MNVAFQALVLFVYLLPGLLFRRSSSTAGQFREKKSLAEELTQSVVSAIVAHCLWLTICGFLTLRLFGLRIDLFSAAMLASGNFGKDGANFEQAISSVTNHPVAVLGYFSTLSAAALCVGRKVREWKSQKRFGLHRLEWFDDEPGARRFQEWGDFFTHLRSDNTLLVPLLSTVVEVGKTPYLYVGILEKIAWDADGNPESFLLNWPLRRKLEDDHPVGDQEKFYEIMGDKFLIRASEAITLNILLRGLEFESSPAPGSADN